MPSLWTTSRWVHACVPQGQVVKLYIMSLMRIIRPTPFETSWPQHFPLVKLIQQRQVSPLVSRRVWFTPRLTVLPRGESEKNSLRKCWMRLCVLVGWPRERLRERVSTSDPFPLSIQTPLCRPLVKWHESYNVQLATSV